MVLIEELFAEGIINKIRREIEDAGGREVFLIGETDCKAAVIIDYNLWARGNNESVPAIISDLKPGMVVIHNHPSGELSPSAADIRLASRLGNQGIGFAIIDNRVDEVYLVVKPKPPSREIPLNRKEILDFFKPEGKLSGELRSYEFREEQLAVVDEVMQCFNQNQFSLIEAGTGTGKSFAYLIPALHWAHENEQTVAVSTNTINLQEQLLNKDLILLKKVLPFPFKAVLVKGRSNYLCRRKLANLEKRAADILEGDDKKGEELSRVLKWLETTEQGTRSDLNFVIRTDIWEEIASESDLCLRTKCPYFDNCFFMQARKEVFSADLLLVNHHLLLSDAVLKNNLEGISQGILPNYSHLIIDEAQNFADSATAHLGQPFYQQAVQKLLQRLFGSQSSLLVRLHGRIAAEDFAGKKKLLELIDQGLIPDIQGINDRGADYFLGLKSYFGEQEDGIVRLTPDKTASGDWLELRDSGERLLGMLIKLGTHLKDLYRGIDGLELPLLERYQEPLLELESALNRCQQLIKHLEFNLSAEDQEYVFWLEETGKERINQENAPLEIAALLTELLWEHLNTLVLTSATLTVNNSFSFFKNMLGLIESRELKVDSPFSYGEQASLLIPEDIPPANSGSFLNAIMVELEGMLRAFQGRTMVLFTSYSMLNYCLQRLKRPLIESGIEILAQGRYPRSFIIDRFKSRESQVIFGTVSFWEGVDIRGDNLSYLVIMKLPFPVPSEPVAAARMEKMAAEGKNPFIHYSLPRAVIRFRQGFGRLIRSRQDRGIVVLMDNRILSKSYGQIFLNSLPTDCPVIRTEIKKIRGMGKEL